jgi:hypothetical protein
MGRMSEATDALTLQMLRWICERPRDYGDVMEAWRTSCPRLSIWEDASIAGLVVHDAKTGKVLLSAKGRALVHSAAAEGGSEPSSGSARPAARRRSRLTARARA